jgi:hypothetical protein
MRVGQIPERVGIIDGGVTVGHFHVPPAFQRRESSPVVISTPSLSLSHSVCGTRRFRR